jgi:hypothetical protein
MTCVCAPLRVCVCVCESLCVCVCGVCVCVSERAPPLLSLRLVSCLFVALSVMCLSPRTPCVSLQLFFFLVGQYQNLEGRSEGVWVGVGECSFRCALGVGVGVSVVCVVWCGVCVGLRGVCLF